LSIYLYYTIIGLYSNLKKSRLDRYLSRQRWYRAGRHF